MSAFGLEINKNQEEENKITNVEELNEEKIRKLEKCCKKFLNNGGTDLIIFLT